VFPLAEPAPAPVTLNLAKIYPYVIPVAHLEYQSAQPEGLTYPLGHGLGVTLIYDIGGLVRDVAEAELTAAGLTPQPAHARALENLVALVKSGAIPIRRCNGPQDKPFLMFTEHSLSPSCMLLPGLRALATKHLGTDRFCVCLPHRDSMILFPTADEAFRAEMMSVIRQAQADARGPLSFGLFQLDADGVREFKDGQ
jgi:hypothetical protein